MSERAGRLASPLAIGGLVAVASLALRLRDPHVSGAWGYCPTKLLTDLDCPLCGGLRAVNDLTHLDLAAALSSNVLVVLAIPVVLLLWARRLVACWRGGEAMRPLVVPTSVWVVGLVVLAVFTVVRNLPGSWLAA
ncbi:DUF2752 domain-containing protein [Nocardioides currus]|uniref:DUF2752 domain-containing protein n=1 Tax=Nocardioides currus TaxID=2133958 RepID=A0A2R7YRW4_9ACTN|nr:DUF2752 domain-containing protein [Nocardioides currus]PUA79122.1 DUF2752 domain-containing protein [Nocardioides currus]